MKRTLDNSQAVRKMRCRRLSRGLAGLVVLASIVGQAQEPALVVGNVIPVTDPLGRPFKGINGSPESSSRVEIRATFGGRILSPTNEEAQLDYFNPLMRVSYLGHDVAIPNSGLFSETFVSNELHSATSYYARVFDWTSRDTSIYYADSLPFAGMPSGTINPEFGALNRVDGEEDVDTDGDGLPDAFEDGVTHTIPSEWDTDGDGYSDWFEAFYDEHMNSNETNAPLEIQINVPENPAVDPYTVSWWTIPVPDMTYRLEFTDELDFENPYIEEIWSGTATETHLVVDVEDWVTNSLHKGFFRVVVPYDVP